MSRDRSTLTPLSLVCFSLVLLLALAACGPAQPAVDDGANGSDRENAVGETTEAANPTAGSVEVLPGSQELDSAGVPVGITVDGYPFRGDPAAPVVMEEFSDFQCPFCARFFTQTLSALEENQIADGETVLIFYDFPLTSIHPQAMTAHLAARCALDEGAAAFWKMHDILFARAGEWSNNSRAVTLFNAYARELELDTNAFSTCLEQETHRDAVETALNVGSERGVNSTPSFFLNDQPLIGAQPLEAFEQAIATVGEGGQLVVDEPAQEDAPRPAPTPATLSDVHAGALGDPQAPVTIVEFTDYQCPFCARHAEETLPALLSDFIETGRVYYVLKDYPLDSLHPRARVAAVAARCAGEQDAYWEMHSALFDDQERWADESIDGNEQFTAIASDLGLDTTSYVDCLSSGRYDDAVAENFAEGNALGVNATPYFFVDGYPIRGAQPLELFSYAVGLAEEGQLGDAYQQPAQEPTPEPAGPVDVPLGDAFSAGDPDAPVTIVEYTDYQCPYCSRHFEQTLPQIFEQYVDTGVVRYVFKDFPLTNIHPQAVLAAEAARCARDQGEFLAMHNLLFSRQGEWSNQSNADEIFAGYAQELELERGDFETCLTSGRHEAAVMADLNEGVDLGVRGTPAFFINGRALSGAQPFSVFEQAIAATLSE